MTDTIQIPLTKLKVWEGNVRRIYADEVVSELAASIGAHGLLKSLIVRKVEGDTYAVVDGGLRLRALQRLAKAGTVKKNLPIACSVLSGKANATEISLAANMHAPMHPADEFEAFKELVEKGIPVADVAARFGVTETVVQKRLRLARVSPILLDCFRKGDMTLEHLMAFTVSNDHGAQERVWNELPEWRKQYPNSIRAALTENEITAQDVRVRFVTLKEYEKAGGAVRRDLFSEGDEGVYIEDAVLLERLVAQKLEKAANAVRKEGWKWVEVRSSFDPEKWSACRSRYPERAPLPAQQQREVDALTHEAETLEELEDLDDEQQQRLDSIQERIEELDSREPVWPPETLAIAGAVVTLGANGKADVQRGFIRPEDAQAEAVGAGPQANGATAKTEKGIHSAALLESLTAHRSAALTAALTQQRDVALAAAVHALASQVFYNDRSEGVALQISARVASLGEVDGSPAAMFIGSARERWSERLPADTDQLFDWCLGQDSEILRDLLAFCVAQTVNGVLTKGDWTAKARFAHAARLHEALKLDMTAWFTPTAANYFGKISKTAIFEVLRETNGGDASGMTIKKSDLAALAERHVAGTGWLPEPLRAPAPLVAAS